MARRLKWIKLTMLSMAALLVAVFYVNCGQKRFSGSSPDSPSSHAPTVPTENYGGSGIDGKLNYYSYGSCPGGAVQVKDAIVVTSDFKNAAWVRQECVNLETPKPLPIDDLQFGIKDSTAFRFKDGIFDLQTGAQDQRLTTAFCQTSESGLVQVMTWKGLNGSPAIYGAVTRGSGVTSGAVQVDLLVSSPPSEYISAANQAGQFDLKFTAPGSANLTYSFFSGTENQVANLSCGTQQVPTTATSAFSNKRAFNAAGDYSFDLSGIPAGRLVSVQMKGAGGGDIGGSGEFVSYFFINPGAGTLSLVVGGGGAGAGNILAVVAGDTVADPAPGGWGGGGASGCGGIGGGGGGRSELKINGTLLAIAGGGGGGGWDPDRPTGFAGGGVGGYPAGTSGGTSAGFGGLPGTQFAGGLGGSGFYYAGLMGMSGLGGSGGNESTNCADIFDGSGNPGGGGGGGYFGGGGGGSSDGTTNEGGGGGGGGSGYLNMTYANFLASSESLGGGAAGGGQQTNGQNGSIYISW